jgi:hypothetical protein
VELRVLIIKAPLTILYRGAASPLKLNPTLRLAGKFPRDIFPNQRWNRVSTWGGVICCQAERFRLTHGSLIWLRRW